MPTPTTAAATPGQGSRQRQPAQLLALGPAGVAKARHQRPGPDHQTSDGDGEADDDGGQHRAGQRREGDRLHGRLVERNDQAGSDHQRQHEHDRPGGRDPGPPAPAGRRQRPGRGQQQHEADQGQPDDSGRGAIDRHPAGGGKRPRPCDEPIAGVAVGDAGSGHRQPDGQQQPAHRVAREAAHRVAREAAGQQRPHRGGDQDGQQPGDGAGIQLGQLRPPCLARQVVEPGDASQAEQGQRPQRPRRHARPSARPGPSGAGGHRHRPGCIQRATGTITSTSRINCQCGQPPFRERYGQRSVHQQPPGPRLRRGWSAVGVSGSGRSG
jgi:hypothetical protein